MPLSTVNDWTSLAARHGLEPLGPVPADLPNGWLLRLEDKARHLARHREEAGFRVQLGEVVEEEPYYAAVARHCVYTDALEDALRARLLHEYGARRRWLEVWLRQCVLRRIAADPEVLAHVGRIEHTMWRVLAEPLPTEPRAMVRAQTQRQQALSALVRDDLLALVERRNELARGEGVRTYHALACAYNDAPEDALWPIFDRLRDATDRPMAALAEWLRDREGFPFETLAAMNGAARRHLTLPNDALPPVDRVALARANAAMGLPDWGIPHQLSMGPFGMGGICSGIDALEDVRIVVSDKLTRQTALGCLYHEYGHALHGAAMARAGHPFHLGTMLLGEPGPVSEMLAMLLESVMFDRDWIADVTSLDGDELDQWALKARWSELRVARIHLHWASFERALYDDPRQDVDALARRLDHDLIGLEPATDEPATWAANPLFVSVPGYCHTYLAAQIGVHQLREAIGEPLWGNPEVGPWLARHFWEPAATIPWRSRVEAATGQPYGPEAFMRRLAIDELPS